MGMSSAGYSQNETYIYPCLVHFYSIEPRCQWSPIERLASNGKNRTGINFNHLVRQTYTDFRNLLHLQGIDQLRPSLGAQVQKPFMSTQNQFQLLPSNQQQQYLAQAQAQTSLGSSPSYGEMDTRRFRALPRGGLNGKDGQPGGNDGSIGSPIQSNSPKGRQDQADYLMKVSFFKSNLMSLISFPPSASYTASVVYARH